MWTAVIVTCINPVHTEIVQKELDILVRKGLINKDAVVLAVDDPAVGLGSGSATLNALLLTAEHLSAKANHQVITTDVLADASILICHNGRQYPFDSCGKGFISLPRDSYCELNAHLPQEKNYIKGLVTNIEYIIEFVTKIRGAHFTSPGIWVCSSDMILHGDLQISDCMKNLDCDVALFCTREELEYAKYHGVVRIGEDNRIADIIYRGSYEDIRTASDNFGKYPIISGIVFLSVPVAESLLSLHTLSPVDCCTYMGLDSGAQPLQASLYFDILMAMATDVVEEDFALGKHSLSYNLKHGFSVCNEIRHVRKLLWQELHKYVMKAVVLQNIQHFYWAESNTLNNHMAIFHQIKTDNVIHSIIQNTKISNQDLVINSILKNVKFTYGKGGTVVQHCVLQGSQEHLISIGSSCFLSGLELNCEKASVQINNEIGLMKVCPTLESAESKEKVVVYLILGIHDNLYKSFDEADSTFCNMPWQDFLNFSGISEEDLWPSDLMTKSKCLLSARLYPVLPFTKSCGDILWLQSPKSVNETIVKKWRHSWRISLMELLAFNSSECLNLRRKLNSEIVAKKTDHVIRHSQEKSLLNYFYCSTIEGWEKVLLKSLDETAASFDGESWDPGKAARALACISDLLSCIAGKEGGLRSGPASNHSWKRAFKIIESGSIGSVKAGIHALSEERQNWLKGHPSKIMRAARHYEGAAQILIRHAVLTVKQYISIHKYMMPPIDTWVTAECPARVDLQGGWTDTPPICYELGGSVVNVALLINCKKPIGTRVRRTATTNIKFKMGLNEEACTIIINSINDLRNYQHLTSSGSLIKAAIVCAKIVDIDSNIPLQEQLLEKYGSGLEVHTWSHLPQGSGLGTSSILAGTILAALWLATGRTCDRSSIVHAVLCVEQMLTSGGGWQDQIGGIYGGINRGYSLGKLPLKVLVEHLHPHSSFIEKLNRHLLLIYTGKVRLAKNLLQNVIRNWYARDSVIVETFQDLAKCSNECAAAIKQGDLQALGTLMNKYWEQKKVIAPGCNPTLIQNLMSLLQPHTLGQVLAGAGGGGFLVVLTREPEMQAKIRSLIGNAALGHNTEIYPAAIDRSGITIYVGEEELALLG